MSRYEQRQEQSLQCFLCGNGGGASERYPGIKESKYAYCPMCGGRISSGEVTSAKWKRKFDKYAAQIEENNRPKKQDVRKVVKPLTRSQPLDGYWAIVPKAK